MKRLFLRLLPALLLAALCTWLLAWHPFSGDAASIPCRLELFVTAPAGGMIAIRVDEGHGYSDERPSRYFSNARRVEGPQIVSIPMPPGRVRELQMNTFGCPKLLVTGGFLRMKSGEFLAKFPPSAFRASASVRATPQGAAMLLEARADGNSLLESTITLPKPVYIPSGNEPWASEVWAEFLALTALFVFLPLALDRRLGGAPLERLRVWHGQLSRAAYASPAFALFAVALGAAIASCYPVVFCDKSFVSPNNFVYLLYPTEPTLPGMPAEPEEEVRGADVAAVMWAHVPYSVEESRALWHDHQWPLWNRYPSAGVALLGQGQSMMGDPLHWIVLLAGGSWWAWDLKFVLAKVLFCFGLGLGAWTLTRRFAVAALIGASAAWFGYFAFRFNHPAFFSVCYAPWVILPWLRLQSPAGWRQKLGWGLLLIVADLAELNSGTAKESSIMLLCLNATGALGLLLSPGPLRARLWRLAPLAWASFLFFLLSAPCWLVFFDTLSRSMSGYDLPQAHQLRPSLLLSFFDEIFSQDNVRSQYHFHPSVNFLILSGVLWLLAAWPRWRAKGPVLALALAALGACAMVFGVVPPDWIAATPVLGNIQHIHNTFGCVLVILAPLLAAEGLRDCLALEASGRWILTWRRALVVGALLAALYFGSAQAIPAPLREGASPGPLHSRFFVAYAPALFVALVFFPWGLRWLQAGGRRAFAGLAIVLPCLVAMHFRHGMYVATKFDDYVMNPRTGGDLAAQSIALDRVRRRLTEPYRTVGFQDTLTPGYDGLLGLEGINGPDALWNRPYRELCDAAMTDHAYGWRIWVSEDGLPQLKRFYDLLNLRFYLRMPQPNEPGLSLLQRVGRADLEIYESKEVWPRAFFTDACASYGTVQDFARLVAGGDGRPFAAVQGPSPLPAPTAERKVVPAGDYHLTCNNTAFTVTAPGPGLVVLTEAFETGDFRVTVNGAPASYLRVNHAFKGVLIDKAGEYRIQFSYWPRLLTPALWISALGLTLAVLTPWLAGLLLRRRAPAEDRLPLLAPTAVSTGD